MVTFSDGTYMPLSLLPRDAFIKETKGNFSERAVEIPADLTDSQMRMAREISWRTQQLHLEYKLPYVHGKVGIEEA